MSRTAYFEKLYRQSDPFQYRSRWYEARKRAVVLACLPHERYAKAWELGCSNGVLTVQLAKRCDALLATDLSEEALASATAANLGCPHVRLQQANHPTEWPDGRFDLIVVSEMAYYLTPYELRCLAQRLKSSLDDGGVLLACHWLHAFDQALSTTAQVHHALSAELDEVLTYRDADFLLQAWSSIPLSVAQRERLR
jgi:cyclopropane fatty-acyl-phospholipid synthase-like methyltransferase